MAAEYAMERAIPFLGICFGAQLFFIAFARRVMGLKGANSTEVCPGTPYPVVDLLPEQKAIKMKGGTMRLGSWACHLKHNTLALKAYGNELIHERHRHRFEFNNKYRKAFVENGMDFAGLSPDRKLVEIIELKSHRWFVGVQFHPEFKSQVLKPHPLFDNFIHESLRFHRSTAKKNRSKNG